MRKHFLHTRLFTLVLCICMLAGLCGCGSSAPAEVSFTSLGATVSLTAYGEGAADAAAAAQNIFTAMASTLDEGSATSAVYAMNNAGGQAVVVPGQIVDMIDTAREVYERTDGALDFTILPVLRLWGFDDGSYYKPLEINIEAALELLCFNTLRVDYFPDTGAYAVTMPAGSEITFAAAARGCATDYAIQAMRSRGTQAAIVSMPGCVQTLGSKPDGTAWTVAVANPDAPQESLGYLTVGETAVSSSGGYARSFEYSDGRTYSHLLDPATGYPAGTDLKAVTVVCADGILADCLSTALCILGRDKALDYWRSYGDDFEMMLVTEDNEVLCTSGLIEDFTLTSEDFTLTFTE